MLVPVITRITFYISILLRSLDMLTTISDGVFFVFPNPYTMPLSVSFLILITQSYNELAASFYLVVTVSTSKIEFVFISYLCKMHQKDRWNIIFSHGILSFIFSTLNRFTIIKLGFYIF